MASYDVFLSYNSEDKDNVEEIARRLVERGFKVWLNIWKRIPGEPWQEELEKALGDSKTVAVFVGLSGIGPWENEEMRVALDARVKKKILRVIPVLLPGAPDQEKLELPVFLARLTWVDFRSGLNDKNAFEDLVRGIEGSPRGESFSEDRLPKPDVLPAPGLLLSGWRMSNYRNAIFTGREEELKALAKALLYDPQKTGMAVPQVITCTIGIGKTQLVVEFCYRYGRFFQGVHWINARQDIETEIAACGAQMELPHWPETTPEQVQVTLRAWQKSGPRLVVLDGVESPDVLHKWLPVLSGFRLLLTARHHNWAPDLGFQIHALDLLSHQESLTLLRKLAPRLIEAPDTELEDIAEQLGNLPLALDLAARYLDECTSLTPRGYLQELNEAGGGLEHTSLLNWVEGDSPTDHETNLAATFLLTWQQLNEEKSVEAVARRIFLACGYCAPNISIPDQVIYHLVEGSERIVDRALKRLYNLGLLTKNTAMHPLLAEFARHQDKVHQSLVILVDVLSRLSYEANVTGLPAKFAPLRPHVEAAIDATEKAHMRAIADDLLGNLGTHCRIVAEFEKAESADRKALTIDEEIFGADHTRTALRLNNLGRVLHVEGRLEDAKQHYERALAIDEVALGPTDPTVALRLNNLGMILKDLGDLEGAKEKLESARRIDEAKFGTDHPSVARDVNNIGWILKDTGKFKEALDAFRYAHDVEKKVFGPNHPNIAIDLNNIGWVLRELGNYGEAFELFDHARAIDEEAYGRVHPAVARDISNKGIILKDLGKYQEAQETFKDALSLYEKVYHSDHPEVAATINRLGVVLKRDGKQELAKDQFVRALDIDEKVFGPDHPAVARDAHNLGITLKDMGEVERGKELSERAKEIYERSLPMDHPLVLAVHENLEIFS